jgi:oligopeptide transport system substrate-binding protein
MSSGYSQINFTKPPFNDIRVRRALSLAVDREAICKQLLHGMCEPAYSLIPPGMADYSGPHLDYVSRTLDERRNEARALLKTAGFGPDHPLKFTYRYFDNENDHNVAVVLQNMWKSIGADVDILNAEAKVQYDALRTGDFEVASAAWVADYNDAQSFLYLFETSTGPMNYGKYSNKAYDDLLEKANITTDVAARAKLLASAEALLLQDVAIIPESFGDYHRLVKPYVHGWVDNFEDWHRTRYLSIDHSATPTN